MFKKSSSLFGFLICLTLLAIAAQLSFFIIHYKVSDLLDSLVQSSLGLDALRLPVLLPLLSFFLIQFLTYCIAIAWVWFLAVSTGELFHLSKNKTFWLGVMLWTLHCYWILSLNQYFFPDSFFANFIPFSITWVITTTSIIGFLAIIAYTNLLLKKRHRMIGSLFIILALAWLSCFIYEKHQAKAIQLSTHKQPNIIFIGIDSVRPDFVNYFGKRKINTPHLDHFLRDSVVFTNAFTPLARTFPSWMSILTGKHPLHNHARSNLADPTLIAKNQTLAKELMQAGYQTIYATDEKRFSNITKQYGFNQIIGPGMGIDDFILGGLSDFPLSNLLVNTSPGRALFPFQYSNRAASITYEPEKFLAMLKLGLAHRADKPLFLAVHFCITHWPYTWAQDNVSLDATLEERYINSLEEADRQFGDFMAFLSKSGLLNNSILVILSDHGTTLGIKNDRAISKKTYQGDPQKIKLVKVYSYDKKNLNNSDFVIDTSYGQGNDVLSLHQNRVLLAIKNYGAPTFPPHQTHTPVTLFDLAPTILEVLKLPPLKNIDGVPLTSSLLTSKENTVTRPLFIESGHSISEIETNDIFIEKVIKNAISLYAMNPKNGQIFIRPEAEKSIKLSKQRAVLWKNWFLAKYPESSRNKLVQDPQTKQFTLKPVTNPAYIVILNTENGEWGIGLNSPTAQKAPTKELMNYMKEFYREENS